MTQHPRSRRISYCIIISAKNKGSVTFVVARCGEAFWAPSSEAPLVSPSRKNIRERLPLRTLLSSAENAGKSIGIAIAVP